MSRSEFSRTTKQAALIRSGKLCEAVGQRYGLDFGKRCNGPLGYGVQFDHITADSHGGENSLENCAAVCRSCHRFKTDTYDTPVAAKIKRVQAKNNGTWRKPVGNAKLRSRGFQNTRMM
jgi:5-methylcytosine-specific restriction enzyme A